MKAWRAEEGLTSAPTGKGKRFLIERSGTLGFIAILILL
jgi:hypothetical protein